MNYLGLTNAFLIESGASDVVASLDEPADDVAQAMHWIAMAWERFQLMRYWRFRFAEDTIAVTAGKTTYTATDLVRADGDVIIRDSFWNTNSGDIEPLSYEDLRVKRRAAASSDQTKVAFISLMPTNILDTYPDVLTTQTLSYDYWKGVQTLASDTDIPYGLPSDYHMLISHKALADYGALIGGQEGATMYAHHGMEYRLLFNTYVAMAGEDNQIPPVIKSIGG